MIDVRGLRKEYDGFVAVADLSFSLGEGEILGIVGPNGAGKTTTLKMIATLIKPTAGRISIAGLDPMREEIEVKRRIGFLPEESPLYEQMTVKDYLIFFAELYGLDTSEALVKIEELLDMLSLSADGKRIGDLSKGMRRKVAIIRSLINDPDLLIYDEPTSGLDPMTSQQIIEFVLQLKEEKKTVIFSAHNLHQVERICDRVMIMKNGRVVASGTIGEIRDTWGKEGYILEFRSENDPPLSSLWKENGYYRVRCNGSDELGEVTRLVIENGGEVIRITPLTSTLEEIFLRVMDEYPVHEEMKENQAFTGNH